MSRSYKHTPWAGDTKTKWAKRQANKHVRSKLDRWGIQDNPNPSWYKKISESWNICDFYSIMTWRDHLALIRESERKQYGYRPELDDEGNVDMEKEYQIWAKAYRRK